MLRTSTSLRTVSSNPGAPIKTTRRPSRSKDRPDCTAFVQDSRSSPTPRLDPLTRLTNFVNQNREGCVNKRQSAINPEKSPIWGAKRTVDFPVPVGPTTLWYRPESHIIAMRSEGQFKV